MAITPACGFVDTFGALVIGLLACVGCQLAIRLIGFFGTEAVNSAGADGLLYGGGLAQLGEQVVAVLATAASACTVTFGPAR